MKNFLFQSYICKAFFISIHKIETETETTTKHEINQLNIIAKKHKFFN